MALTTGVLSQVSVAPTQAVLSATAATGGTGPYTYQWYRSTTTGFTPGGGNILAGKTALSLTDTGLVPGTQYYYKLISTDTGDSNITVTSSQLAVTTPVAVPDPNQFSQSPLVGMIDQRFDYDTIPVQIDAAETGTLYPGQAVKVVDSAGGVPKVLACSADTDDVFGFINYDIKNRSYVAGSACEISQQGNIVWLRAIAAIARGAKVVSKVQTVGGVGPISGAGAEDIVGWAFDKAAAAGDLIRVRVMAPSFLKDGS